MAASSDIVSSGRVDISSRAESLMALANEHLPQSVSAAVALQAGKINAPSGHPVLGELAWGSHFCHFYETARDLADCHIPYLKAGLENNEACFWATAAPFGVEEARAALRTAVPDLDRRLKRGQIEIVDGRDYYSQTGELDPRGVLDSLLATKDRALARGYTGLRAAGNTCPVKTSGDDRRKLVEYETMLHACCRDHQILGICSYHVDACSAADTVDVVRNHHFTFVRRSGAWEAIETTAYNAGKKTSNAGSAGLSTELAAVEELQRISTELVREHDMKRLYGGLVDAAAKLMRSDFATMQMLHPNRGRNGELQMLAHRGFDAEAIKFWDWVRADSGCTCGYALRTGRRGIATDIATCDFMAGTPDHDALLQAGVRAAQSTPLFSRSGRLLGMLSTHWRKLHTPANSDLQRFDILARLAADLIERTLNEEQIKLLGREAEHRAKNVFATVQATVRLTQADSLEGYKAAIQERLQALANTHSLFGQSGWGGADLRSLVLQELSPYGETRFDIDGADVALEPNSAQALALCLHELTTNAAKHGALSVPNGRVQVDWSSIVDGQLALSWSENDGPPVKRPSRRGFGVKMIETLMQMSGKIEFDWRPQGLRCEITMSGLSGVEIPKLLADGVALSLQN